MTNIVTTIKQRFGLKSTPQEFSFKDWKNALFETKDALSEKNLTTLAAGIAYYMTMSFFPLLAGGVALAALFMEPENIESVVKTLDTYLPKDVASLVSTQLSHLVNDQSGSIWIAIIAITLSLFSASGAVQNMITATNTAYDVEETRNGIIMKLISIAMTLGIILFSFIMLPLLIVTTDSLTRFGISEGMANMIVFLRWPLILVIIGTTLAAFYRYAPDRQNAQWQWVSWGGIGAAFIWLVGTALFFFYAQNFANFSESFGTFAGIIVLMTWFNLTAFILLLGAEINHRMERQR